MKYAYVEITERCNLKCPFCPSATLEQRREMPVDFFKNVLNRLKGNVSEIFLHVLGEPLLHPHFPEILRAIQPADFQLNLTTNGTLISKYENEILGSRSLRQVNFSTHAYAYMPNEKAEQLLAQTIAFAKRLQKERPEVYLNFRLWNDSADVLSDNWNSSVFKILSGEFEKELSPAKFSVRHKSIPIAGRIYLHRDSRFEWPEGNGDIRECGTCHGTIDQCAVLSDGRVVPCCLDYRGNIPLGKFPEESFETVLCGERAKRIREGFLSRKLVEPFCQRCPFSKRFR